MKTLIIYDNEGFIVQQITGSYRIPIGLPFLEVEIPNGKHVVAVNVETKEPIFEDIPPSDIEILRNKIAEQEQAILELTTTLAILQGGYN